MHCVPTPGWLGFKEGNEVAAKFAKFTQVSKSILCNRVGQKNRGHFVLRLVTLEN